MPGLTTSEARSRLERVGPNALPAAAPDPVWRRLFRQFRSPLIAILVVALVFDAGLWIYEGAEGLPVEALAIALILLLNAALGIYQEQRSEAALAKLTVMAASQSWVVRDGRLVHLPSSEIVPGDHVRLEAGDRVPADGALTEAAGALFDEAVLTGESVPVDRSVGSEALSGTLLVRGRAMIEVTRTGSGSAMGQLASMLGSIVATATPLERRVDALGRTIARWVLVLATVIGVVGILAEGVERAPQMIIFAVALAAAAVPEGLPAVLTVALALGVERMARQRAVVRRLSAVEALGSVTVIATDKTGTLTESRMDVRQVDAPDAALARTAMILASDADIATGAGDPLELGLLRHVAAEGTDPVAVRAAHPVIDGRPFDAEWKFQRTTVTQEGRAVSYFKGAPEVLIARSALDAGEKSRWMGKADDYARQGYRVLALAHGEGDREEGLSLLGLVLLWDPPRPEVAEAVGKAQAAGIRVVMITGDHPATALAIAGLVGVAGSTVMTGEDLDRLDTERLAEALAVTRVFARVRPEQKLRLVDALQHGGAIVAMTGDGVNDAPALKKSDVGIAMGQRGSDVSREVADLVLVDDNFATIVGAVEEGRGIYENIQKFLRFLFSTNLSEVLVVGVGAALAFALGMRDAAGHLLLPLTAAQILWINLMTDGLPALALAFDRTPGVMQQPPRPTNAPLLDRQSMRFIAGAGSLKALLALALLALVPALGFSTDEARAVTFHFMALGQLALTYPSRHTAAHPLPNPYLHAAVAGGVVLQVAAGVIPWTSRLLGNAGLPLELWLLCAVGAVLAWVLAEGVSRVVWRPAPAAA